MKSFFLRAKPFVALWICFSFLFLLASCGEEMRSRTVYAMDTVLSLRITGGESDLDELSSLIVREEKEFSVTDPSSAVSRLNSVGSATFSQTGAALLTRALELCAYTNGAFDVTIYPIVKKWGFTTGAHPETVPTDEELTPLLSLVDYTKLQTDGLTASLPKGMQIDLGGIVKGHLGDLLRAECHARGVSRAIFNLGGSVVMVGNKKNGKPWSVAISDADESGYIGILSVSDTNVVTSGAYERYFEINGTRYGHILDPKTGRPATGLLSVTVVGKDGVFCDALSTALFVMGPEKAKTFCLEHNVEAILQEESGAVFVTRGLASSFVVDKRFTAEVIG